MSEDEKNVKQIVTRSDTRKAFETLKRINENYEENWPKSKPLQNEVFNNLAKFINEKPEFCNVSLTIIVSRSHELEFAKEIIARNGIDSLMRIMTESTNDLLKIKACCALGKMAKFDVGHLITPVSSIINFLSTARKADFQVCVLYILTFLGINPETREKVIAENGIVCIANILKSCNHKVLQSSIRAIAILSQDCSLSYARQHFDLGLFKVIVELYYSHTDKLIRKFALMSLKNFSFQEEVRSELIKVGVIKLYFDVLSSWISHEMNIVAVIGLQNFMDKMDLWRHNGIDGIKPDDILPVLFKILKNFIENKKCNVIGQFRSKDEYLEDSDEEVTSENDKSRNIHSSNVINAAAEMPNLKDGSSKKRKNNSLKTVNKLDLPSTSSSSITSNCSRLGVQDCTTKICSPIQKYSISLDFSHCEDCRNEENNDKINNRDPELYIPSQKKFKNDLIDKVGSVDVSSKTSTEPTSPSSSESESMIDVSEEFRIDYYVLLFIQHGLDHYITRKYSFSVLIDYLCFIHDQSFTAVEILAELIKVPSSFKKLIENGLMEELEDKMTTDYSSTYSCVHNQEICDKFYSYLMNVCKKEAKTHDICSTIRTLLTSEKMGKLNALCAMPELVTEKSALYGLLFECEGLSMLFSFLSDSNITIRRRTMVALCKTYQLLKKDRKSETCFCNKELPNYVACERRDYGDCMYEEMKLDVTFSVDSGAKVRGNRDKLCENSDYFAALLKGNFKERDAKIVSISGISEDSLTMIFHFLHGCFTDTRCYYIKGMSLPVMLQLLSDCDRLLLTNIKNYIESRLYHITCSSNSPAIYKQAQIDNHAILSEHALHEALSTNTSGVTLLLIFKELLQLKPSFKLIPNIEILFKNLFIE